MLFLLVCILSQFPSQQQIRLNHIIMGLASQGRAQSLEWKIKYLWVTGQVYPINLQKLIKTNGPLPFRTWTFTPTEPTLTGKLCFSLNYYESINGGLLIKMCSTPGKWHLWSKWMQFNLCPQLSNLKLNRNKASKEKLEPFRHRSAHSPYSHPASPSNLVIQSLVTGLSQWG